MKSLAISLGHNASAVLIEDGRIVAGYEEERFSAVKSDSNFPIHSIHELKSRFDLKCPDVYVGHWFIDAQLPGPNKYWQPQVLQELFPGCNVDSLSADFTHHDSHLESAKVFAGKDFAHSYTAIVADGFGSFGECISIYKVTGAGHRLLRRMWGFDRSLGMLYQYATAFMGMKMHNHEYKMLAYEVHIERVLEWGHRQTLVELAQEEAKRFMEELYAFKLSSDYDPVTSLDALPNVQVDIDQRLSRVARAVGVNHSDVFKLRVVISWFVQRVVELVMTTLASMYSEGSLMVVGGLFYNVKLNHLLAGQTKGKFCAMPLAGDQGAALGVYQAYKGDLQWPGHLAWGHRTLNFDHILLPPGVIEVESEEEAIKPIQKALETKGFVNLVRGAMEFGPRALCNTSTLALPSKSIAENINRMNDRTMEMPFAPVMTREQADEAFVDVDKIHRSLEYMICTRTYRSGFGEKMPGAAHLYPDGHYTGRPQITSDPMMVDLLREYGPLVNTSYNFHGVPIVRSPEQILDTHVKQWDAAPDLRPITVVIRS
jgi:predicted NodU family carbamoyl transferase